MPAIKLKPEVKEKWTAALRSGDYKQGIGQLKRTNYSGVKSEPSFCCLGVLCEVLEVSKDADYDGYIFNGATFTGEIEYHWAVENLFENSTLDIRYVKRDVLGFMRECILNNDSYHMSFEDIANWVEKNY